MNTPTSLDQLLSILNNLALIVIYSLPLLIFWLGKSYIPSYFNEKGKNLATKDDIGEITKRIEQVKIEYTKELELHRSGIWLQQQKIVWLREEFALKLDTYKKSVFLISQRNDIISEIQVSYASREINGLVARIPMRSEKNSEYFRDEYEKSNRKLESSNERLERFKIDLKEITSILAIYFTEEISENLKSFLNEIEKSSNYHWTRERFDEEIKNHISSSTSENFDKIVEKCIAPYLAEAAKFSTSEKALKFLISLEEHMKESRAKIIDLSYK